MSSAVPLTTTRYPHIKRKEFAVLSDKDIGHFESVVGNGNVLQKDIDGFNTDWLSTVRGVLYVIHVGLIYISLVYLYMQLYITFSYYTSEPMQEIISKYLLYLSQTTASLSWLLRFCQCSLLTINDFTKLGTPLFLTSSICRTFSFC